MMDRNEFMQYLGGLSYDKYYQDIEAVDFVGYSRSFMSWENIRDLVVWKNKKVVDLGCFHGYFSFKAEGAGARVLALDKNTEALATAEKIREGVGSSVVFRPWFSTDVIPIVDITLCMNVFHYFPNQEDVLRRIHSKEVIFEINKEDLPKIEKYFRILVCRASHRPSIDTNYPNRWVLLGEPI